MFNNTTNNHKGLLVTGRNCQSFDEILTARNDFDLTEAEVAEIEIER